MLACMVSARDMHRSIESSFIFVSSDLKIFGLYLPCFGTIVSGYVTLAAIA